MTTLLETLAVKLVGDTADFDKKMGGAQSGVTGLVGKLGGVLGGLTIAAGAAAAGAALAVGKAAFDMQASYDDALDAIINGTGASGAALDAMGDSVRTLAKGAAGLNVDMKTIGATMAEVNTRTGATGAKLEGLTGEILQFSRLTGTDSVNATRMLTRTMGDWGVSLEDSGALLDQLYGAGQTFGIGFDQLSGKLVQFGAPLRQMGFSLEESIALFGKWEKEGVNAELVVGSLRIAAGNFARDNIPLRDGLNQTMEAIKGAASESDALSIAMETFGARAGPDMAAAIREGRFELDEAITALQGTQGGLADAAERTLDFRERWQISMAQIKDSLLPLGESLAALAERIMPLVVTAVEAVIAILAPLIDGVVTGIDAIAGWIEANQEMQSAIGGVGASLGDVFGPAMGRASQIVESVGGVVNRFVDQNLNFFRAWIDQNMPRIQQIISTVLNAISSFWEQHGQRIVSAVSTYFGWVMDWLSLMMRTVLNTIQIGLQILTGDWEGAGQTLQGIIQDWKSTITRLFTEIVNGIVNIWRSIDWGGIGRAIIEGIGTGLRNAGGWLADQARNAAQSALDAAKGLLGISSPSKVAADEIGEPFAEGIGEGMRNAMRGVTAQMDAVLSGMVGALEPAGSAAMGGGAPISITLSQYFQGNASPSEVRIASSDGVLAGLRSAGL